MDGLAVGIDLCDAYTQITCFSQEQVWTIPTVICKQKKAEEWFIGEEAYGHTLLGDGIIVDKLLKLVQKDGTATLEGVKYEGLILLKYFLEKALALVKTEYQNESISQLVITLQSIDVKLMDCLLYCADYLHISRADIHIISHSESFVYYVLSQKKEVWNNHVGMFELSQERLCYYEMKVQRGMKLPLVISEYENLEEGFNLSILDTNSGGKLGDKILCSCGERLLQKKMFSAVFLTGKGFERQDWAVDFMKLVCNRRKGYVEPQIFSKGAAFKAADYTQEKTSYPVVCICEGRLGVTVSMPVLHKEKESQLVVASAGDNWYESKSMIELIADGQDYLEFMITPLDPKQKRIVKFVLEGFPKRPPRTTRMQVTIGFLDEKTMAVAVKDKGFGELFPATDLMLRQEVML